MISNNHTCSTPSYQNITKPLDNIKISTTSGIATSYCNARTILTHDTGPCMPCKSKINNLLVFSAHSSLFGNSISLLFIVNRKFYYDKQYYAYNYSPPHILD